MKPFIAFTTPSRLLNPASGYLAGYTHTLNPYTGCAFACSYCYVREMPVAKFRPAPWGTWVDVKEGAAAKLHKELVRERKKGGPITIFLSSATDPYQPIEYRTMLTRSLLETMLEVRPDFVLVQTRSPLAVRDIDVLQQLGSGVRVSMTIETDLEEVRKAFSPAAPPIPARLRALRQLCDAGIPAQAAVSPLLPSSDAFADRLADTGVQRICLDDYFMGDGSLGKRTARLGLQPIYQSLNAADWYDPSAYLRVMEQLKRRFAKEQVRISQAGFMPF
jgi:DNA repair photolyase